MLNLALGGTLQRGVLGFQRLCENEASVWLCQKPQQEMIPSITLKGDPSSAVW